MRSLFKAFDCRGHRKGDVNGDRQQNAHIRILGLDKCIEQSVDDNGHCKQTKSAGIE